MYCQNRIALAVSFCTVICVLLGCGTENAPKTFQHTHIGAETVETQLLAVQPSDEVDLSVSEYASRDEIAEDAKVSEKPQVAVAPEDSAYEPPFPDRVDLFKVPQREGRGIVVTSEGIEEAVELIGFVNVDSPQVVLSIDGKITPLEEGSVIAEIEVISIQPPAVVLQRGRQRWQATLEN